MDNDHIILKGKVLFGMKMFREQRLIKIVSVRYSKSGVPLVKGKE
jgi:hypothetical protein